MHLQHQFVFSHVLALQCGFSWQCLISASFLPHGFDCNANQLSPKYFVYTQVKRISVSGPHLWKINHSIPLSIFQRVIGFVHHSEGLVIVTMHERSDSLVQGVFVFLFSHSS